MVPRFINLLRSEIKTLVAQEGRFLRAKQAYPCLIVLDEIKQSVQETKRRISTLVEHVEFQKRNRLIRRIVDQTLEEEIDHLVEGRKDRCLRCLHMRFFDETGRAHAALPHGNGSEAECDVSALTLGCEFPCPAGSSCAGFTEKPGAPMLQDHVSEMASFYELKEMFDDIGESFEEYLTR